MPLIRTVFQPDAPREVDEAEAAQLDREGLLLPMPTAAAPVAVGTSGPAPVAAKEPADGK